MSETVTTTPEQNLETQAQTATEEKEETSLVQRLVKMIKGEDKEPEQDKKEGTEEKETESKDADAAKEKTGKLYSDEELQALIDEKKSEWEADAKEQERIKKLSPEEQKIEMEKQKDAKIAELERTLKLKDLTAQAVTELEKDGYPTRLTEIMNFDDESDMRKKLDTTKDVWKSCMEEALRQALKGKTPDGINGASKAENSLSDIVANAIKGGI